MMNYDDRRLAGLRAPACGRTLPRRHRWLPPALAAVMLAMVALAIAQPFQAAAEGAPLNVTLFIGTAWLAVGFSPFARGFAVSHPERLGYDEFELTALARATARAYAILALGVLIVGAWHCFALRQGWPALRRPVDWAAALFACFTLVTNLPAFLAEIAVPFPTEEVEA